MKHPQVWTTTKRNVVDLALVPVDMSSATDWSIYPGMLSDHLPIQLKIQHTDSTNSKRRPRRWLTDQANWEQYRENITDATIDLEWQEMDTNETNITTAIINSASATIPSIIRKIINKTILETQFRNRDGKVYIQCQAESFQTNKHS